MRSTCGVARSVAARALTEVCVSCWCGSEMLVALDFAEGVSSSSMSEHSFPNIMVPTAPLRVRTAATVICVRRQLLPLTEALTRDEATGGEGVRHGPEDDASARLTMVFGQSDSAVFPPGWDVLLGQREAQNWLRSEPGRNEVMRYPAEWNFAGGAVELGEEPAQAARRELEEITIQGERRTVVLAANALYSACPRAYTSIMTACVLRLGVRTTRQSIFEDLSCVILTLSWWFMSLLRVSVNCGIIK